MKNRVFYLVPIERLYPLFQDIKQHQITIYDITYYNSDYYMVTVSFLDTYHIKKHFPDFIYYKSVGLYHYICLYFNKRYRVIGIIFSVILFMILSQLSYGCIIDAQTFELENIIKDQCELYEIDGISLKINDEKLTDIKNQIRHQYSSEISYLDMYKEGHFYKIKCLKKIVESPKNSSYHNLVSNEDAIVDKIDVKSGNVLVEEGQYVSKGQVLVSNEIISTNDSMQLIEVEGKIYGYVYHTFQASVVGELNPENFSYLYQEISHKLTTKIGKDGHIVSENVLQYEKKEGKIVLKMQFTLYQNIAQERFLDE